nr:MAG: pyrimidine dimer DNA glycosylase [Thermoproteus sp. AZ2]
MQVFRPYIDWKRSAAVLDNKRLGKQRVEAKQVLLAILRKAGLLRDGRRGWLNHPIVLMYFNGGRPYIEDLVGFFNAVVDEWRRRGFANSISLEDIRGLLKGVGVSGTPITHVHEVEYRRILMLKEPCWYLNKFPEDEVEEVFETEPTPIKGINLWLFAAMDKYREFVAKVKRGERPCRPLFPPERFP